jgi:hypothetical protein
MESKESSSEAILEFEIDIDSTSVPWQSVLVRTDQVIPTGEEIGQVWAR